MTLTDISKIISAAPSDLQGAKIIDERLLTTEELSVLLRVSQQTLRRMAASGGLPFVKVGGELRYSLRALDAYLNPAAVARNFK
jgi:excisionase family DNA binding protein